ncbi:MAG: methyltransferase domain-containing protein [Chloroflexota bacterium]
MNSDRLNYDNIADIYDRTRALSKAQEALWLDIFENHLGIKKDSRVLDVGCGTGRFSISITNRFQCTVIGIDPSLSMLVKAKTKYTPGTDWSGGIGEAIPFSAGVFEACLASQVIHHFQNKPQAFAEIYRVLRPGGRVGIRISSHEQLQTIIDYRFFPSAYKIECDRLPDVPVIKDMLFSAGFDRIEEHVIRQLLFENADEHLQRLRDKYASILSLISEEEYCRGLQSAKNYFREYELTDDEKYAKITFIVGCK